MNKTKLAILACIIIMLLIALLSPFRAWGDSIKPGLGDLLNGMAAFVMMFVILGVALAGRKRH